MAVATPRISVFLNKRRAGIEGIATLRAEEVASVPFRATSNNDFALDWRLAGFAARAEHFVEVQGAVEAHRRLAVGLFGLVEFFIRDVVWDVAGVAGSDAF